MIDGIEPVKVDDAGIRAKKLLHARAVARAFVRKVIIITAVIVTALIITAVLFVRQYHTTGWSNVERACSVTVGDVKYTGGRTYRYPYVELLGIQLRRNSLVEETTYINANGGQMTVVATTPKMWWSKSIGVGEPGKYTLPAAKLYTVVVGKEVAVVGYNEYCLPGNGGKDSLPTKSLEK